MAVLLHPVHLRTGELSTGCQRLFDVSKVCLLWPSTQKCQQLPWVLYDFYYIMF